MKKVCMLGLVLLALGRLSLAQDKVFDWVRASDEVSQLDPADYHAGRVYRPGADGGGMHVDIQARQPVTVAMAFAGDWDAWQQHPESQTNLEFRCMREHVTSTTYECHMLPNRPMVLLIRDERTSDRAVLTGIGAVLGRTARQFISPNDVKVTYYSWTCVQNCIQPEFQWFSLVKEKYELTPVPKIYSLLTPERDGQRVNVRIKAPVPMTIALLPSELADQVYDNPGALSSALSKTSCKQRGVQSLSFYCTVNLADGRQSLVVVPDAAKIPHKKAEIELQTVKCAANCELLSK
jgi:hypothetical protein